MLNDPRAQYWWESNSIYWTAVPVKLVVFILLLDIVGNSLWGQPYGYDQDHYFPCEGTGQSHNQYYTNADALAMDNVEVQIIGVTKGFKSAPMECLVKTDSQIQVFGEFESMFEADAAEINDRMNAATKARQEVQCGKCIVLFIYGGKGTNWS